ncbi:MAG: DUF1854 domain-containing protein [Gammaproteobacteria bacterium]|nr:DUF1854 domain-containing protein [Gammaproteobacteria bacterium]MBU1601251.1 DUF1854 domain-containing protein [Gammaproteobacteria bacterium]MBU2433832.1 DUF1854 domain-containing protein [Gammaproteobacteria bacterium]MBU2450650.1 DUF1854 domain-containing protein [Gammaproteobacteria bacterium]
MSNANFQLQRDSYGQLVLTAENGIVHQGITPVRAFPIAAPDEGLSLVNAEGHEVAWIDRLADLPPAIGQLIESELASREFVPEIERIETVSSFACPSTWQLATNRGPAELILKGEEDIRRLSQTRLLIADAHGIQFLIRDLSRLDKHSRKLLDRFL